MLVEILKGLEAELTKEKGLEAELAKETGHSDPLPEEQDKSNKGSVASLYPQQPSPDRDESLITAISPLPASQPDDEDDSELHIQIDEDSDYDIYDILMDSEFDDIESDTPIKKDTKPQQAANDQGNTPATPKNMETEAKNDPPEKQDLEEKRFMGIFKKGLLSKKKQTG
jgi:hypothetical protein